MASGLASSASIFPDNAPMPPGQLVGLTEWIPSVAEMLANGTNTAVPAGRKQGKTSACGGVILRVQTQLGMLPIRVDLYETNDEDDFLEELKSATLAALLPTAGNLSKTSRSFLGRLIGAGLGEAGGGDELRHLLHEIPDGQRRAEAILQMPDRVGRLRRKVVLLFIDEAQRMSGFSERFMRTLNRVFRESTRVRLLLAGTEGGMMDGLQEDPLGPLSELVQHRRELDPIGDDEWTIGLGERFAQGGCTINRDAAQLIIEEGKLIGASPVHSTIMIAKLTHMHALSTGRSEIDRGLALQGFEAAAPDLRRIGAAI